MPALVKESFAIQLRKMSVMILDVSEILFRLLSDPPANSENLASQVSELALECRECARSFLNRLNRAAVKPLDEISMRRLSDALKTMMELLEQVSSRSMVFKLKESIPFTAMIAETISQQAHGISSILADNNGGQRSPQHCEETIRLKEQVDRLHESCTLYLFDVVSDPVEVVKRKQIIDDLQRASIAARDVGYILRPLLESRS